MIICLKYQRLKWQQTIHIHIYEMRLVHVNWTLTKVRERESESDCWRDEWVHLCAGSEIKGKYPNDRDRFSVAICFADLPFIPDDNSILSIQHEMIHATYIQSALTTTTTTLNCYLIWFSSCVICSYFNWYF